MIWHMKLYGIWYAISMIWYDLGKRYDMRYDMLCDIWYNMTPYDMMYDMIWYDICCVIWHDICYVMICYWYDIWYDVIYDIIWHDIWYDMLWYMVWYGVICNQIHGLIR